MKGSPIGEESLQAEIGHRVLHEFREDVERHGGDIGAGQGRLDDVHRVPERRREQSAAVRLKPAGQAGHHASTPAE